MARPRMKGFGSLSSAATGFTADPPRAFRAAKPMARTLTAGERSAVIAPSIVAGSNAGGFEEKPFGAIR